MKTRDFIFISLWFYIGWFGCVLLASTAYGAMSFIFPAILFSFLFFKKQVSFQFINIFVGISLVGIFFDSLVIHFEWMTISGPSDYLIPIWLVSIWFLFALSIPKLGFLIKAPLWVMALLGCIMGPLSYKSGELFEVLTLTSPWTIFIYALFWTIFFPMVIFTTRRFHEY